MHPLIPVRYGGRTVWIHRVRIGARWRSVDGRWHWCPTVRMAARRAVTNLMRSP